MNWNNTRYTKWYPWYENKKKKFIKKKKIWNWTKDLNGNNILNYIYKRVILRYKIPLSWRDHYPFNTQEDTSVLFHRNSNSILRRDNPKISYERRAYESVDEKSLS